MKLLNIINETFRESMPPDVQQSFNEFYRTSRTYIENQKKIQECYREGMKIDAQLFDTKIVTLELNQKLDWYHSEISRSAFWQNTVQVDTYEDRKKLLQYLSSQISAFDLKLWFVLQELRFHHNQMLNRNKMNKKDIQFMDENYEELKHEILIRRGFMKKLYQKYVTLYSNYEKLNRRLLKNKSNNRKNLLL